MEKDDNIPSQCSHGGVQSKYEDRLRHPIAMEEVLYSGHYTE